MLKALELAKFAEKNGWIVIEKEEGKDDDYIRFLTPSGQRVLVQFSSDGQISNVYP